jgi:uncharacterized YigZ family protein
MADSFLSIEEPCEGGFKDRGSKFLAYAFPVCDEEEIKSALLQLRKEHPSARHHCYAWRLGAEKVLFRANDDGEPSGTAGKPILGQIQSKDLSNILIVVVRYFGGTLLGTGGLINAYREAAADAINRANIIEKHIMLEFEAGFNFELMNDVMKLLKDLDAKIISQDFNEKYSLFFYIRKQNKQKLEERVIPLRGLTLAQKNTH